MAKAPSAAARARAAAKAAPQIPHDCGYCNRQKNCMVYQSFLAAIQQGLNGCETRIPGLKLQPALHIQTCPEFEIDPELEAEVREKMAAGAVGAPVLEPKPDPED